MRVKIAALEDFDEGFALIQKFHSRTPYYPSCPLEKDKIRKILEETFTDPTSSIVLLAVDKEKFVGILVGLARELSFSSKRVSCELMWFSDDPRALIYLWRTYEYWAKEVAKVDLFSGGSYSPSVDKFLEGNKMVAVERSFLKELN